MLTRTLTLSFISCLMLIACNKGEAPKASEAPSEKTTSATEAKAKATEDHAGHGHAEAKADAQTDVKSETPNVKRVFFVSPANGT